MWMWMSMIGWGEESWSWWLVGIRLELRFWELRCREGEQGGWSGNANETSE